MSMTSVLFSDADGEVVLLEELMVKQLYKDKSSSMLYSVSMQANVVTAVEAITDKWTITLHTKRYHGAHG